MALFAVIILFVMNSNLSNTSQSNVPPKNSLRKVFVDGIVFMGKSKTVFFFITGGVLTLSAVIVWANLILFPIYFGYTGTDDLSAVIRVLVFVIGTALAFLFQPLARKINPENLPLAVFLYGTTLYGGFSLLT